MTKAKKFVFYLFAKWFRLLVIFNYYTFNKKYLYYIDSDNTLAHTYPTLLKKEISEAKRLRNLTPHINIVNLLKKCANRNRKYIFISARSYLQYPNTIFWLRQQGFKAHFYNTILVETPKEKVNLIEKYYFPYKTIVIDDLTYNHEYGQVLFYNEEIQKLLSLRVKYIGYNIISKLIAVNP